MTACPTCGRRHFARRDARPEVRLPLLEWAARQPLVLVPPPRPALRLSLRQHLSLAREARRQGDYSAASIHETDALLAAHAERAASRMEARHHV